MFLLSIYKLSNKKLLTKSTVFVGERSGFEPPKAELTDLQSAPFGQLGNSPHGYKIGYQTPKSVFRVQIPDLGNTQVSITQI